MVLDNNGYIEQIGQAFIENFGKNYKKLPLGSLFFDAKDANSIDFANIPTQKILKKKVALLDGHALGKLW